VPESDLASSRGHTRQRRTWGVFGLVGGGLALALYGLTGARGVEWQDSGIHQYRILTGLLEHPVGLALAHPVHYWLGRAALCVPAGDPVWKINFLSALGGAATVGLLTALVGVLTRSTWAAVLAAATLALAHVFWQMSALTETYTLAAALMTLEWLLFWRYLRTRQPAWLVAVFATNGLHVADHLLGLLTLVTYGVLLLDRIVRRRIHWSWLFAAAAAWLATASPYWTLVLAHFQRTGDVSETLRNALFGGGAGSPGFEQQVLNTSLSLSQLKLAVLTLGYCFPSLAGLVALVGVLRRSGGARRRFRRLLLVQTLVVFVFVGRYSIRDQYTYFVPVCVLTALWFGVGAAALLRRWQDTRRRVLIALLVGNAALSVVVYFAFPPLARERGWFRGQMRAIPYRDEYSHFLRPWRFLDDSPARLARGALTQAGADGWIMADSTTVFPIAVAALTTRAPEKLRIYWTTGTCLVPPGGEPFTRDALRAHVAEGGSVLAVPSPEIEPFVGSGFRVDKSAVFWVIR
jgi:hypothetical protein